MAEFRNLKDSGKDTASVSAPETLRHMFALSVRHGLSSPLRLVHDKKKKPSFTTAVFCFVPPVFSHRESSNSLRVYSRQAIKKQLQKKKPRKKNATSRRWPG